MQQPSIPTSILRAAYELERDAWQRDLAQLRARLAAQQHIAEALGHDNRAHIQALMSDMEAIATGLAKIEELLAGLDAESTSQTGKE